MSESPRQFALGFCIARIEFPHLGFKQVAEEEGQRSAGIPARLSPRLAGWKTRPPFLGFLAEHKRPADILGVFHDTSLNGFVFGGRE